MKESDTVVTPNKARENFGKTGSKNAILEIRQGIALFVNTFFGVTTVTQVSNEFNKLYPLVFPSNSSFNDFPTFLYSFSTFGSSSVLDKWSIKSV